MIGCEFIMNWQMAFGFLPHSRLGRYSTVGSRLGRLRNGIRCTSQRRPSVTA